MALLTMFYKIIGQPESIFGLNIMEQLGIKSIYNKNAFIKMKYLLSKGYPLKINKNILKQLLLNKDFFEFYSKNKSQTVSINYVI